MSLFTTFIKPGVDKTTLLLFCLVFEYLTVYAHDYDFKGKFLKISDLQKKCLRLFNIRKSEPTPWLSFLCPLLLQKYFKLHKHWVGTTLYVNDFRCLA